MPQPTPRTHPSFAGQSAASINAALLATAHAKHSIYETTRMSGEQKFRHKLPVNQFAESADRCSDATDNLYANSLTNHLVMSHSSRL